jgi:hypothetical protein
MLLTRKVGPIRRDYGDETDGRAGYEGQAIVSNHHGWYHEACLNGNMFVAANAAAGLILSVAGTAGGTPTLWNPAGSGVELEIISLEMTWVSGTNIPGAVDWYITNPAGGNIAATGSPICTFTHVDPVNCLLGSEKKSKAKWAPAVNTFAAVPTFLMGAGISLATFAATGVVPPWAILRVYDGGLIVGPGVALSLCSGQASATGVFHVNIFYAENRLPSLPN